MFVQFALALVLALSWLASPSTVPDSSTAQDRAIPHARSAATSPAGLGVAAGPPSNGVVLKDLEIVVPPVKPSNRVAAPDARVQTQSTPGSVIADQLVSPDRVESEVVTTAGFQTLGVTWPEQARVEGLGGQVRTRTNGEWSKWADLEPNDNGPDAGTPDAARAGRGGTDPIAIGDAEAVQLAFTASADGGPAGLSLALVGSPATPVPSAVAGSGAVGGATVQNVAYSTAVVPSAVVPPRVIARSVWGAPAQACRPGVASALVGATVHHTAGPNGYADQAHAMQQIRNDAVYHISALKWCDIGYNFVVDKWGNIYEGRAHSLTQPVIGAHAGGFNSGTVGVAMLGTYDAAPSTATQRSVAQIIGWRLGAFGVDPKGSMTYRTGDGGVGAKFKNQNVALPRLFGHRDVWFTACPGNGGYAAVRNIRAMASTFSYPQRFTQAQAVVKALYQDLLGRTPDAPGLASWSTKLAQGTNQADLVYLLTRSDEYIKLRVAKAYKEVLLREPPDPAGAAGWLQQIRLNRATVDDVQRRFFDSAEFMTISGGTDAGYVAKMYQSILGRAATSGEVDLWVAKLANGRGWVVDQIWFSQEAASTRAGGYYQTFLKRAADPAGRAYWAQVLLAHGEGAVRAGIAGSPEYRSRAIARYP